MTEAGGGKLFGDHSLAYVLDDNDGLDRWLDPAFHWSAVVFDEDWHDFQSSVRTAVSAGGRFNVSCRLQSQDSGPVLATVAGETVSGDDGKPSWIEGVITPRENARICNGCREAVIQGEKKAKEFCRNILSVLSHDIRSPLIGVIGMIQLLRKSGLNDHQSEYATVASESCERILELAKNLLDFAKIDSGKDILCIQPVDVATVVDSVTRLHLEHAKRRAVILEVETTPGFPAAVLCDEIKLRQILGNLISNAIKFTPAGSVKTTLSHARRPDGSVTVLVKVTDTGIGFDVAETRYMFDQFAQLCHDPQIRCMGAGLGLTIVKNLVALFGGAICADSEPGKGATFHVSFPAGIAHS